MVLALLLSDCDVIDAVRPAISICRVLRNSQTVEGSSAVRTIHLLLRHLHPIREEDRALRSLPVPYAKFELIQRTSKKSLANKKWLK
jgi:hypothetical protein